MAGIKVAKSAGQWRQIAAETKARAEVAEKRALFLDGELLRIQGEREGLLDRIQSLENHNRGLMGLIAEGHQREMESARPVLREVDYRHGLPSPEQVAAHAAANPVPGGLFGTRVPLGMWQAWEPRLDKCIKMVALGVVGGKVTTPSPAAYLGISYWRPCYPNGSPLFAERGLWFPEPCYAPIGTCMPPEPCYAPIGTCMPPQSLQIVLECNGVLGDFLGHYLSTLKRLTGRTFSPADVTSCEIEKALALSEWEVERVHCAIEKPGWCSEIQPLPGAQEGVKELFDQGHEIIVATSPWKGHETWHRERLDWLWRHYDISESQVVFTFRKERIAGNLLVEDNPAHAAKWPHGSVVLIDQPYNRPANPAEDHRRATWDGVKFPSLPDVVAQLVRGEGGF